MRGRNWHHYSTRRWRLHLYIVARLLLLAVTAGQHSVQEYKPSGLPVLNPHRGFRYQIDGLCGSPTNGGHNGNPVKPPDPAGVDSVTKGLAVCHDLNLTVTLGYCYLGRWWNNSLSEDMLANLGHRFSDLRKGGVSVLLNFAYEDGKTNYQDDVEPYHFQTIYAHIEQLAPVLLANADVIYGVQAGFIGNAGEWAHDIRGLLLNSSGVATMVSKLLYQALPPV